MEIPRVDDYPEDKEDGYLYRGKMYKNLGDKYRVMQEDLHATSTCKINSHGYDCVRHTGHGMFHRSSHGNWWMLDYRNEEEQLGIKPWSDYRLINDSLLDG